MAKPSQATRDAFIAKYNLRDYSLKILWRLSSRIGQAGERESTCETHPEAVHPNNREQCAALWKADRECAIAQLCVVTKALGFDGITFHGLYPILLKHNQEIHIPR